MRHIPAIYEKTKARLSPLFLIAPAICAVLAALPPSAFASVSNHLYRVDIRPKQDYTRITVKLQNPPDYVLKTLPGNRLRLVIQDTGGTLFKKMRRYSDNNIGGMLFSRRGESMLATFQVAPGAGWRDITREGVSAITLDVGKTLRPPEPRLYIAGREKIWNGVEKLVRDFDPPLKPEIPFLPTDRQILKNIVDENGQQLFMAGESALYKGSLSEAEEIFTRFASEQAPIRSIALYRLGETFYKSQKYPQALAAFREAERLLPAYLNYNPGITFYYGDSIARGGDLPAARSMLAGLIARLSGKQFAPALLVRLGDILTRQGHQQEALGLYRTVAGNFKESKANRMALLRLDDRDFLLATPWTYRPLSDSYLDISQQSGDLDLREEALFKHTLLESLHGETSGALRRTVLFQKKFPRGIYATVCRTMREVLVAQLYRETRWTGDDPALIRFVEEQQEYLAGCMELPEFLPKVAQAYDAAGRPIELIKLFDSLLDRQWAAPGAPFMYEAIAENADLLGDLVMAEKYMRLFLRKYPSHAHSRLMLERLGALYYSQGKHQETKETLLWLLNKKERAIKPESYYFLGRSLWMLKQLPAAIKAMDQYLASNSAREGQTLADAYYIAASARELSGDRKGALRLLDAAINSSAPFERDALFYKAGELSLLEGKKQAARSYFDNAVKKGVDPDWQKLGKQALDMLDASAPTSTVPAKK